MLEGALKYCKEKAIDLLAGFVPKTYSMAQDCFQQQIIILG